MNILRKIDSEGFPTEYVISRVRGRRIYLLSHWREPETIKEKLLSKKEKELLWLEISGEFRWLYGQMNRGLREIFAPLFSYFELKTLFQSLRYKYGKEMRSIKPPLENSLLLDNLKVRIMSSEDILSVIEILADLYAEEQLTELYSKDGFRAVEERLYYIHLTKTLKEKTHPIIKEFFRYLVDLKNLLGFSKHLRWGIEASPFLIRGGHIEAEELKRAYEDKSFERVKDSVKRAFKREVDIRLPGTVESALLRHITGYTRKVSFELEGVGLILDYIWRFYIETRNRGLLFYGMDMDRAKVLENIVYS